ncbi:hypothetical protein [Chelativorans alearense]|uniref:hypothetical protein n=1 Tax=Chelativorans alearense TaxID=2681495 RepID=UPI0013D765F0|nr:hypothetical protein [Chelativorans alearense]
MASIPGYCPYCGFIFDGSGGIHIENSLNVTVTGSRMTCPNCGQMAFLVDGTFSERGRGLELVSGPPLTRMILDQLQEIARKAQAQEITPEEVIQQAETIDPQLGKILKNVPLASVISIFIALVALYLSYEGNRSSSEFQTKALEILERQAYAVEEVARSVRSSQEQEVHKTKRNRLAKPKSVKAPPSVKNSTRRRDVNKARREALKERRRMFPRRIQHKPSF